MPAGDAGLERQAIHEGMAPPYAVPREWLVQAERERDTLRAQLAAQQAVVEQKMRLNHQLAAECVERHSDQHRLRDQIAALVAWIRARQHIELASLTDEEILWAINQWAELQAQAAQPEGEPR